MVAAVLINPPPDGQMVDTALINHCTPMAGLLQLKTGNKNKLRLLVALKLQTVLAHLDQRSEGCRAYDKIVPHFY